MCGLQPAQKADSSSVIAEPAMAVRYGFLPALQKVMISARVSGLLLPVQLMNGNAYAQEAAVP
jgi:hypothetical protein